MPRTLRGPAVEVTVKVRYPLPRVTATELDDLGATSVRDLVRGEVAEMEADPSFLADLIESDRSEVSFSFELDCADDPFGGGDIASSEDAWGGA